MDMLEENRRLEKQIQELENRLNAIKKDRDEWLDNYRTIKKDKENLKVEIKQLEGKNDLLQEDLENARAEKEHIEEVYKEVVEKLEDATTGYSHLIKVIEFLGGAIW